MRVLLALVLLAWFLKPRMVRVAAFIATLEFAAILAIAFAPFREANFLIIFRDVGLLGAALALFLVSGRPRGIT